MAGEWDDAVVSAERAATIAQESDEVAAQAMAGWTSVLVPAARGHFDVCDAHLRELHALPLRFEAHIAAARMAFAEVAAARADHAGVIEALAPLVGFESRDAIDEPGHWPWPPLQAQALLGLGRLAEAEACLVRHEAIADKLEARSMRARLARVRGLLAAAREDDVAAEAAFRLAAELLPIGMPYERALTAFVHGRFLRRGGGAATPRRCSAARARRSPRSTPVRCWSAARASWTRAASRRSNGGRTPIAHG